MMMRLTLLVSLGGLFTATSYAGEHEVAIGYVEDAVAALQAECDHIKELSSRAAISEKEVIHRRLLLVEARLILRHLKKDEDAITNLLHENVGLNERLLRRCDALVERGVVGRTKLAVAQLNVLASQLRLAEHTGNAELKSTILKRALDIEKWSLTRLEKLMLQGVVSSQEVAAQKLRIASLIAKEQIVPLTER